MNEIQSRLFSMYMDIAKVLDSHGVKHYMLYGTAIGVLRHDGFIPWDDDIDIGVWEEDLPNIEKWLREELDPEKYYYHAPTADTHPHVMYRCENFEESLINGTAPFIDIFPIVRYPTGKFRSMLSVLTVWGIHFSVTALDHIGSIRLHRTLSWIPRVFKKLSAMIVEDGSNRTAVYTTSFQNELFPREWYGEPVMHKFESASSPLPQEYDRMLKIEFGDYMTPPPEDKRSGALGFPLSAYKDYIMESKDISCKKMP